MRTSQIIAQREAKRARQRRSLGGAAGLSFSTFLSLAVAAAIFLGAAVYIDISQGLPPVDSLPLLVEAADGEPIPPTRIYDRTGQHLLAELTPAGIEREYLRLEDISPEMIEATLALIDPDFWDHPGYSLAGINSENIETLAQRLAATYLLEDEQPGIRRGLRERMLAAQLTRRFGREQLLEWYLNNQSYGPQVYGVGQAARVYFAKSAAELTLAEAAALAAASQTPEIDPAENTRVVFDRQRQILAGMLVQERISEAETLQATLEVVTFRALPPVTAGPADGFILLVKEALNEKLGSGRLERGGLTVITSLDMGLQAQVNCAAAEQLKRMNGTAPASLPAAEDCEAAQLLPGQLPVRNETDPLYHVNAIVLDPASGQVLALTADEPVMPGLSPASSRPAGTLLTPFIYLAGFTRGMGPASLVWDIPGELLSGSTDISPETAARYHGPVRLRTAFANDYLGPAAQVLAQIGAETAARTANQLGLLSIDPAALYESKAADGIGGEASLLETAQAYGVVASLGFLTGETNGPVGANSPIQPVMVLRVEGIHGEAILNCGESPVNCHTETRAVISRELAYLLHHVLSDENSRWASLGHPNLLEIGRPAGAKLGRVDSIAGWTAGYVPQRVVVTWVGAAPGSEETGTTGDPVYGSPGVRASASLWRAIIQYTSRNLAQETSVAANGWLMPPGLSQVQVCDPSGMLPTNLCPTTVTELFLAGSEPVQYDTLYHSYQVNRETGRLATIFTPPGLVQEQLFMQIPAFALPWADAAGIETAPRFYDVIYSLPTPNPAAQITSPEMFAYGGGKVQIRGTAAGSGFKFYRLQAGAGLNPAEWIQLGDDIQRPVQDGLLAEWDTTGLSGLYALQLLVVRQDQTIDSAVIQITLDNQPPEITFLNAAEGQPAGGENNVIILHAAAGDETDLARVEFYIDNELISTLVNEPYTLAWEAPAGTKTFRARAYDMAGNWSEESVQFTVK